MSEWIKRDLKHVWHPYTQMKDCGRVPPILIERAKGLRLYDNKGNVYYDTISSWWCNVHGHNHPKIRKAISKQLNMLEHVMFAGFTHKPAILLAERLVSITPNNLKKVFFSDNGSTAVETALKMSYQYWHNKGKKHKKKFLSLDYGYHGDTIGTMSISGVDMFNEIFSPLFFESFKAPSPYCYRCPMGLKDEECGLACIKPLEDILKNKNKEIAALVIEPLVLAAGGMIVYPGEYLREVARLSKKYNVHLILDEVATGFGRTGKMFACEYDSIEPDFMCLSKGITAGFLPLGVTLTTNDVYDAFYADYGKGKTFHHGHTYTANPISCAAALASLDVFKEEGTLDKIADLIPLFADYTKILGRVKKVGNTRQIGLIGAAELVKNRETKEKFDINDRIGFKIYKKGLKENLILRPIGNVIYFFMPSCVKKNEIEFIFHKAFDVIDAV